MTNGIDISLTTPLEKQGVPLALVPGNALSLHGPETIYLVLEGKLDVFLVEMRNGKPEGARHPLFRVECGNSLVGFDTKPDAAFAVIANPTVGSKVIALEQKEIQQAAAGSPEPVIRFIENWVQNLGLAISTKPAPKEFQSLAAGAEYLVEGKSTAILPLMGVVWIRHTQGSSCLLGDGQLTAIEPGSFFPVSRQAWLQTETQAHLRCLDTRDWLKADPQWSGLSHFQEQIFHYLVLQRTRDERKEKARLHAVAEADAAVFESALHRLAGPLRTGEKYLLEIEKGASLLDVCRFVATAGGIPFPPLVGATELAERQDSVSAIAQAAHLRTRQVMLRGKWWTHESLPMVGFSGADARPIALIPGPLGYQIYDPDTHRKILVDEDCAAELHGFAYVFYRAFPSKALVLRDILGFGFKNCGGDAATIIFMGIAAGLLGIAVPALTGVIFDTVIPGAERGTLAEFTIFLGMSALATALFTLTRSLATLRLQSKMEAADPGGGVGPSVAVAGAVLPQVYFGRFSPAEPGN